MSFVRTNHPDDQVLIPHGLSPTGFGLFWNGETGMVRAITPCCGAWMVNRHCECLGCGVGWEEAVNKNGATAWMEFNIQDVGAVNAWSSWIGNLTGWKDMVSIVRYS